MISVLRRESKQGFQGTRCPHHETAFSSGDSFPQCDGSHPVATRVKILSITLAAAILTAFIAVLGMRWFDRYAQAVRGLTVDLTDLRRRRQTRWRFDLIDACSWLVIHAAVFLHIYDITEYLSFNDPHMQTLHGIAAFGTICAFLATLFVALCHARGVWL